MQNTPELRDETEASALRVFAANGFGAAPISRPELNALLSGAERYHRARAHRSYELRQIVLATRRAVGDQMRRMIARWKHQQQARATYLALLALDSRTLRDLGVCELSSAAAEARGTAGLTRCRFVPIRPNGSPDRSFSH